MLYLFKRGKTAVLLSFLFLAPFFARAGHGPLHQEEGGDGGSTVDDTEVTEGGEIFKNPLGEEGPDSIVEFLNLLLEAVVTIAVPIIALSFIWVGFLFVKAQGNSNELQTARTALWWTIIGALVVLGAQALSMAIEGTVEQIRDNARNDAPQVLVLEVAPYERIS